MKKWIAIAILAMPMILVGCANQGQGQEEFSPEEMSANYAGTLNGQGMPIEHFNFYQLLARDLLLFWQSANVWDADVAESRFVSALPSELLQIPEFNPETVIPDSFDHDLATQSFNIAFARTVALHLTVSHATEFGFSLDDIGDFEVELLMEMIGFTRDPEIFAPLGFTDETFNHFLELKVLQQMVYMHIASLVVIDKSELIRAFEQFLLENEDIVEMFAEAMDFLETEYKLLRTEEIMYAYILEKLEKWKSEAKIVRFIEMP